jgi:hypothetical protein
MSVRRRRNSISGQFSARLIAMLESPSLRVLSLSARRVLDRIEIEHAHHGGYDNGRLPVTFSQLEEFGIDRHAIAPAIRECVALGFLEVTERGCAGNADFRKPNLFRLTYRHLQPGSGRDYDPTDEWRRIGTIAEAEAIARAARSASSRQNKKQKTSVGKRQLRWGKPPLSAPIQWGKPPLQSRWGNPHYLYISGG